MPHSHVRPIRTGLWIFCAVLWTGAGALVICGTIFRHEHVIMLWGVEASILAATLTAYLTVSHAFAQLLVRERRIYNEIADCVARKALDQLDDDPRFDSDGDGSQVTRIR